MILSQDVIDQQCPESHIYNEVLELNDKNILELGCGKADITRAIATDGVNRHITALEVDLRQHEKNLLITDLENVSFQIGGAEAIPVDDNSQDVVFMFKSLHHVPIDSMDKALQEIHRVLTIAGRAYISEPVYKGDFNDILRLFNDEQDVRMAAFSALENAIENNLFRLEKEIFFNTLVHFEDFTDFEEKVLNVTHMDHRLSDETYAEVKIRFETYFNANGGDFIAPMRVDLLQVLK